MCVRSSAVAASVLGPSFVIASVLALASFANEAHAAPPEPAREGGVEFRWDAPANDCPDEAHVLAELERLLGKPLAEVDQGRLTAIARVRLETDGRWDLRLWTVTGTDTRQRSMIGADCKVLADAAALLAAMAIDPNVLARMQTSEAAVEQAEQAEDVDRDEPLPEPLPEPEPEPEPELEPEPEPLPEPTPPPLRPTIGLRAHAGISIGDLPSFGPIVRLALAVQWWRPRGPGVRIELEGHYAFARETRLTDSASQGADLQQGFVAIRGCPVLRHQRSKLEFPICVGFEGGALIGKGVGFPTVTEAAIAWLAIDLAPGIVWAPIRNLAIGVHVEPWVALARPRFRVEGAGTIWRSELLGFRALGGLEVRF